MLCIYIFFILAEGEAYMSFHKYNLQNFFFNWLKKIPTRVIITFALALSLMLSSFYLQFAWNRYQKMYATESIKLAESLATLMPVNHIKDLLEEEHADSIQRDIIKEKLIALVENTSLIHYVYIMGERDGESFVLVDSNVSDISSYSPLDDFDENIYESDWIPFKTDKSVLTKPIQNKWGGWIRALVPVKDSENDEIIAILGFSYSAKQWNLSVWKKMIPDIIVDISLLILLFSLMYILFKHSQLKERSLKLSFNEELYRRLFQQAPIGITLSDYDSGKVSSEFVSANPAATRILGRDIEELRTVNWAELSDEKSLDFELDLFERFKKGEIDSYCLEKQIKKPNEENIWVNVKVSSFINKSSSDFTYLCLIEDISVRKEIEETLKESERSKAVLLSHLPGMAYRCCYDKEWTMEFVSEGCLSLTGYSVESFLNNHKISYNEITSLEYREILWDKCTRAVEQKRSYRYEYEIITKSGERKWVLEIGQGVYDKNGKVEALEGIILDISEQKKREAQINYLNERDFLTGLYNRSYLENIKKTINQQKNLPLSVAVCDINGLRMINDAYGQTLGDRLIIEAANLIQNCCRSTDVLGRVGGGEFLLFMPNTSADEVHLIVKNIHDTIDSYNRRKKQQLYEISLTIGHSTIVNQEETMEEAVKVAESYLKHRKLLNQKSLHHSILSSIMATLYAKSQETEEHGQRLGRYAVMIGERLGLEQKELDNLSLLSMLHDIGKIGIDDGILNKPGKLTPQEWEQMKKHPEIGHRIAMSTPELEHIAEYILCHHERWDAMGYPLGLEGEKIPLLSRILALADAYDAMTEDRVYRKALSFEDAMEEIKRCSGTQFDPDIVDLFVKAIEENPNSNQYPLL